MNTPKTFDPSQLSQLTSGFLQGEETPSAAKAGAEAPALSAQSAWFYNNVLGARAPLEIKTTEARIRGRVSVGRRIVDELMWIALRIDGHPAWAGLTWGAARRLVDLPLEGASPADSVLLVEDALGDWLEHFETQTGLNLRFVEQVRSKDVPSSILISWDVSVGHKENDKHGARFHLPLALSKEAASAVQPILSRLRRPRETMPELMLRASLELAVARLTLDELKSLRPGDALVIPAASGVAGHIVVEDQLFATATSVGAGSENNQWRLSGPLSFRTKETSMSKEQAVDDSAAPEGESTPKDGQVPKATNLRNLDALEVRVSFRVGESLISLESLRSAGEGTVLTLDRPDNAPIEILVNGQMIGTGDLVSVSGQRAIEIQTLFDKS